ncbi:MAG TPA: hypothetical protein ENK11_06995 [Phycisphaerales bacterium]|nr:hypothetical protein [Phycisphaerales bacterium]
MNNAGSDEFVLRPHPLMIVVGPLGQLTAIALTGAAFGAGVWVWRWAGLGPGVQTPVIILLTALVMLARLVWAVADWAARVYGLTGGTVWAQRGVLHRRRDELPIAKVQSVALDRPLPARLLGLGTLAFASAGTAGYEVVWYIIGNPDERLRRVRGIIGRREGVAP